MTTFLLACFAYILGSVPSGLIVGLLVSGRDVRHYGSGNIGTSNVTGMAGWQVGAVVGALDILKGVVPVAAGRSLGLPPAALSLVALSAVIGHDFSFFLRFRGGKGVATTFGVSLALAPVLGGLAMLIWLIVLLVSGYAALASLGALALLPLLFGVGGRPATFVVLSSLLFFLATARHGGEHSPPAERRGAQNQVTGRLVKFSSIVQSRREMQTSLH